ncbi:MAG: CHAT domain-containing protein [Lacibacter sp.]|nr:CHAT domain-containing protein [Lacibacter sp.]
MQFFKGRRMYYSTAFLFLCCLLLPSVSHLQQSPVDYHPVYQQANSYYNLNEPTDLTDSLALSYYNQTIHIVKQHKSLSQVLIDCYIKSGNIFQGRQRYQTAVPFYHKALLFARNENNTNFLYQSALYLGSAKYSLSEIDSARFYFEYAAKLADKQTNLVDLPILYNSLGIIYFEAANYRQAINYFQLAADRLSPADDSYHESLVSFNNNIAGCYLRLGEYAEALKNYRELLQYKELEQSLYQNMGHAFYYLKQYDSALSYMQRVPYSISSAHARLLNEKGRIYIEKGMLVQAEQVFDSAIAVFRQLPLSAKSKDKALSFLYRSQLAQKQGLSNEAMNWCNRALKEIHFNFSGEHAESIPVNVTNVVSPITFFAILEQKASLLSEQYARSGKQTELESSLRTRLVAIETANYIKNNFDNDEAGIFFNEVSEAVYKKATQDAVTLYSTNGQLDFIDAFLFITESYKGNILHRNQVQQTVKSSGLLPDSLLQQETDLKQLLAVFTTRLNNSISVDQVNLIQRRITEIQIRLSRLQKQYENYPSYTALQNPSASLLTKLKSIQQQLNNDVAILQYIWADSVLMCLAVAKEEAKIFSVPVTKAITAALKQYRAALHNPKEGVRFSGYDASARLYQFIQQGLPAYIKNKKNWIVLPDGPLHAIPFETLVTDTEERKFLVQDKIISYHYSFTLLLQKKQGSTGKQQVYASAPFASAASAANNQKLPALIYSSEEIKSLQGKIVQNSNATKEHFIQNARNSSLIHLATHAQAEENDSLSANTFIQFHHQQSKVAESSRLYLHELYSMRFKQRPLVVLSACETGNGLQSQGEGLLSLARGFMYAGSSGIVSSLWKADDQTTAFIMQQMHYYLNKQIPVEQALYQAKKDLLANEKIDPRFRSPAYWGQFIYIGDIQLLQQKNKWSFVWPFALCVVFSVGLFLFYHHLKKASFK